MQVIGSYDNILHLLQYEAKSIKLFSKEKQSSNTFYPLVFQMMVKESINSEN